MGSAAVPASAQRTGPCPTTFGALTGSTTGVTVTESHASLQRTRPGSEPVECLFSADGQVRAALFPAGPDRTTLERVQAAAGVRARELDADAANGPAEEPASEPTPDAKTLRVAGYNPTTPSPQSATTNLRVTNRSYDALDRLESETVQLENGSTATVSYTYWGNGQRKTVRDALGRVTFYEYNGRNLLSRLTANQGLPDEQVTSYSYWGDNLLKTVTKPDGTETSYDYDRADRLRNVLVRKGGTALVSYAYTYDGNGNRESQVEVNGGTPETTTYTYDDLDRLETVTYPDGRSAAYGYDLVGNRTSETERDPGAVVVSQKVAVFDAANRLSTVTDTVNPANNATFAYDRNGNLITKTTATGTATYVYDTQDQLVETRQREQISARFAYDGFGRRYLKIGAEGIRQYLYDQTSLLEEFNEFQVEVAKYEWGGDQLVSLLRRAEPRRYYHFDALGSVAALTDESGGVAARYHYDAWGNYKLPAELQQSPNRFAFTGYLWDQETDLYFAKARFYDPTVGRFTSQDSFLGTIDNPPSLHRYFYAANRPTFYTDPTGHCFDCIEQVKQQEEFLASQSPEFVAEYRREPGRQALNAVGGVVGFGAMLEDTVVGIGQAIWHPIVAGGKVKEFFSDLRGNVGRGYREMLASVASHEARGEHVSSGFVASRKVSADSFAVLGTVEGVAAVTRAGSRALTGTIVESESQVGGFANITPEAAALAEFTASVPDSASGVGNALPRVAAAAAETLTADAPKSGAPARPAWQASEADGAADLGDFGFRRQPSYLQGKDVPYGTPGSVRPDLASGNLRLSVDAKNYNVTTPQGRYRLVHDVVGQTGERATNLPQGMRQGVIIDMRGQVVNQKLLDRMIDRIVKQSNGLIQRDNIHVQR